MTPVEGVALVVTIFVAMPVLYLIVSYALWRYDDQIRRDARLIQRGIR